MRLPQSNHLLSISCLPSSFSVRICKKIPSLFSHRGEEVLFSFPSMPSAAPFCKYNNLNIYQSFYVQHRSQTLIWQFGSYVYIQQDQRKALRRSYTFSQSVRQSFGCLCSDSLYIMMHFQFLPFIISKLKKKIAKLILLCT